MGERSLFVWFSLSFLVVHLDLLPSVFKLVSFVYFFVSVTQLQYADPRTKLWLAGGLVAILLNGLALPACNVLLGRAVSRFSNFEADIKHYNMNRNVNHTNNNTVDWDAGKDVLKDRFQKDVWWILADMLLMCVQHYAGTCLSLFCFNRFAARLLRNIRWHYFRSVLMQDIAWIDTKKSGEFTQEVIRQVVLVSLCLFMLSTNLSLFTAASRSSKVASTKTSANYSTWAYQASATVPSA